MSFNSDELTGEEVVLRIEALDALIPFTDQTRHIATANERFEFQSHHLLGAKLKSAIRMSFYDHARGWLDRELIRERRALSDRLFARLVELMKELGATRRSVREGYAATMRELLETRQSRPRPLSD